MREEGNASKRGYPSRHQAAQAFPVSSESLLLSVESKTKKKKGDRDFIDPEHILTFPVFVTCGSKLVFQLALGNQCMLLRSVC